MRLAVLIIGLLLGLLMFIQTVLVGALSSAGGSDANAQAAASGFLAAILWLIACAFVIPFPLVSVVAFAIAALFSFGAAARSDYEDQYIWGIVALILMSLSFLGWMGKRRERRTAKAEKLAQADRDARYEQLLVRQQTQSREQAVPGVVCHACGTVSPTGTRFCGNCGANLAANQPGTA